MADEHDRDENADPIAPSGISRRRFIEGIIAASAVTSIATVPAVQIAEGRGTIAVAPVFTADQHAALAAVLDRLIPSSDSMPAAGSLGIGAFIEKASSASPHIREHVTAVLVSLPDSRELIGMDSGALDARLHEIERQLPDAFDLLLQAAYTGYYRHPQVLDALGHVKSDHEIEQCFDRFDLDALNRLPPSTTRV